MDEDNDPRDVLRPIRVTAAPPLGVSIGIDSPIHDSVAGRLGFTGVLDPETTVGRTALTVARSMRVLGPMPGIASQDRSGESPFAPVDLTFPQPDDDFDVVDRESGSAAERRREWSPAEDRSGPDEAADDTGVESVSPDHPDMEPRDTATTDSGPAAGWDIDELPTGEPEPSSGWSSSQSGTSADHETTGQPPTADRTPSAGIDSGTSSPTGPGERGSGAADDRATPDRSQGPDAPVTVAGHRPMSVTVSQGRSTLAGREGPRSAGDERQWDRPDLHAREETNQISARTAEDGRTEAVQSDGTTNDAGRQRQPSSPTEPRDRRPSDALPGRPEAESAAGGDRPDGDSEAGTAQDERAEPSETGPSSASHGDEAPGGPPSDALPGRPEAESAAGGDRPDGDSEAGTAQDERAEPSETGPSSASHADEAADGPPSAAPSSGPVSTGDSRRVQPTSGTAPDPAGGREPIPTVSQTRAGADQPGTTFVERLVTRSSAGTGPTAGGSGTVHRSLGASPPSLSYAGPAGGTEETPLVGDRSTSGSHAGRATTAGSGTGGRSAGQPDIGAIERDQRTIDAEATPPGEEPPVEGSVDSGVESAPAEGVDAESADGPTPAPSAPRFPHLPHVGSAGPSTSTRDAASLEYVQRQVGGTETESVAKSAGTTAPADAASELAPSTGDTGQPSGQASSGGFPHLSETRAVQRSSGPPDPATLRYSSSSTGGAAGQPDSRTGGRSRAGGTTRHGTSASGDRPETARSEQASPGAGSRSTTSGTERSEPRSVGTAPAPFDSATEGADFETPTSETEWVTETVPLRVATPVDRRVDESRAWSATGAVSRPVESVTTTTVEPVDQPADSPEAAAGMTSERIQQSRSAGRGATPERGTPHLRTVRRILREEPSEITGPRPMTGGTGRTVTDAPDLEPVQRRTASEDDVTPGEEVVVTEETIEDIPPGDLPGEPVPEEETDVVGFRSPPAPGGPEPDMTVTDADRVQPGAQPTGADRVQPGPEPTDAEAGGPTRRVVRRIRRRRERGTEAVAGSSAASRGQSTAGASPRMTVTDPGRLARTGSAAGGDRGGRPTIRQARGGTQSTTPVDELDIDAPELSSIDESVQSGGPISDAIDDVPLAVETSGPGGDWSDVTPTEKLKHSQKDTTKEMPALTVQSSTTDRTAPSAEAVESLREELERVNRERVEGGGLELGGSNAEIRERIQESYEPQPAEPDDPSIDPELPDELLPPGEEAPGPDRGERVAPDEAETEKMYPDFTFKRLAPQVDATSEPEPRDITYRDAESGTPDRPRETSFERADTTDIGEDTGTFGHSADLDRMIEKLQRQIERRRRIERERRGL